MNTNTITLAAVGLLAVVGIAAQRPRPVPTPSPVTAGQSATTFVAGYKRWARVNRRPHEVSSYLAALCRNATVGEALADAANPHMGPSDHLTLTLPPDFRAMTQPLQRESLRLTQSKFVTVFVNEIGRKGMLSERKPTFPRGSIIVKEKLAKADSASPELLTVMRKRESGYNPGTGDWEFLVLDGTGTRIQARGKLQSCQSCHAQWKATDYVSRAYLSADTRHNLR